MAQLMEHRVGPVPVGHHVREDAHVALTVDVDAERVLALSVPWEEVAAIEDRAGLEADAVEGRARERDHVDALEHLRQVDPTCRGDLLEERILVVPGPEIGDVAVEALAEARVGLRLPCGEWLDGQRVALVERLEEASLVHLRGRDGEREPVAVADRARRLVAQPRELAHVLRDRGADRLRRLPGLLPLRDVVARPQDPLDLVVVDGPATDDTAVLRESRLHGCLELDDAVPQRLGNLVRHEARVEQRQLSRDEAVRAVGVRAGDGAEELGVGHRVGQRELGLDASLLVLVGRGDVRVPPRLRGGKVERPEPCLRLRDDPSGLAHGREGSAWPPADYDRGVVGTDAHRAAAAAAASQGPITVGVITVSDTRTPDDDTNGDWLRERIEGSGAAVAGYRVVKDEPEQIRAALGELVPGARVVIVNGGTGISNRDTTYDTLSGMLEKTLPGFGELFRMLSWEQVGSAAMLSRATAGTYRGSVVVSLPGSPKAVALAWEKLIEPELAHLAWEVGR